MDDLHGKTAVVTGGASGIGLELARHFGAAGMQLVLGDIEAGPLDAAAAELRSAGYDVATAVIDVRELDDIRRLEATAVERFGKVHVLCNNAGVGSGGMIASGLDDLDLWKWTIDIDLWGVIYGCKVFLPAMIAHGEPAHVVNTASMAGLVSAPAMGAYCVSKYGVVALSETLSMEMQITGTNVGVSVLCPAFVQTAIAQSDRNLPDDLKPLAPDGGPVQEFLQAAVASGISTTEVADAVLSAIGNNDFWILTHDDSRAAVTARSNQIIEGNNPRPPMLA